MDWTAFNRVEEFKSSESFENNKMFESRQNNHTSGTDAEAMFLSMTAPIAIANLKSSKHHHQQQSFLLPKSSLLESRSLNTTFSLPLSKDNGNASCGFLDKRVVLYKTEVCRTFEETGQCKYENRCQFAHSRQELRRVPRHPRYKTEVCKTFWEQGNCPYGKRCCFIHTEAEAKAAAKSLGSMANHYVLQTATTSDYLPETMVGPRSFESNCQLTLSETVFSRHEQGKKSQMYSLANGPSTGNDLDCCDSSLFTDLLRLVDE